MSLYEYKSKLGALIERFIEQKQSVGFPYRSSARILYRLDRFIAERHTEETMLNKEICTAWSMRREEEHPNGLFRRVTPVRQFGKYLRGLGYDAYIIPGHIPNKQIRYVSHIYTQRELKAFFSSVDACRNSPFSPTRSYVIPVIFRLIYCCGLRPSEARLLHVDDVDLTTGKLIICESKGWRSRVIYMSDDLLAVCREYDSSIRAIIPVREAFFPNKHGKCFNPSMLDYWFHEFWDHLPEAKDVTGNPARVHAFRHTYAVDRLNQWVREGCDVNAFYPYLSEYMGHVNYANTDYYLSLVDEFYPDMERMMSSLNNDILPEVCHEEE
jgi:integrase/recombinase XerD